jgi:hypothetical protein
MCFEGAGTNPGEKTLEDKFFEYEVSISAVVTSSPYKPAVVVDGRPNISSKPDILAFHGICTFGSERDMGLERIFKVKFIVHWKKFK